MLYLYSYIFPSSLVLTLLPTPWSCMTRVPNPVLLVGQGLQTPAPSHQSHASQSHLINLYSAPRVMFIHAVTHQQVPYGGGGSRNTTKSAQGFIMPLISFTSYSCQPSWATCSEANARFAHVRLTIVDECMRYGIPRIVMSMVLAKCLQCCLACLTSPCIFMCALNSITLQL
ncbi:hypothetical protein J3F84DRAFT_51061 [Trichoderma pleuroticola]